MRHFLIAAIFTAAVMAGEIPRVAAAEVLITKSEATLPSPPEMAMMSTRGLTRGPRVEQVSPDPRKEAKSPFALEIKFVGHNDVAVDPASVKVTYLKTPSVDLTSRLKGHISANGIDLSDAEVPPGTHLLRVDVLDRQGRAGHAIVKLSVLP